MIIKISRGISEDKCKLVLFGRIRTIPRTDLEKSKIGKLLESLRKKHADDEAVAKRHTLNFLAHKDESAEALKEGWTAKQILEQMTEDS